MSYNGSGTFNINTAGQPVVTGTVISTTAFNALTADLGTGLSTAITKDGQTTTTARIPFAAGINSSLVTDATNTTTGSIITAGGMGIAKALFVGTTLNVAGASTLAAITGTFNGTVGATTPAAGAFTTLSATGTSTLATVNASGSITTTNNSLAMGAGGTSAGVALFTMSGSSNAGGGPVLRMSRNSVTKWEIGTQSTFLSDGSDNFNNYSASTLLLSGTQAGAVTIPGTLAAGATTVTGTLSATGVVTFSNYGVGTATFNGSGVISSVSDETWKVKDGAPVDTDAMLNKLEPGYWYYNDEKKETFGKDRQLGFYAQNVNAAIGPEAAPEPETFVTKNDDGTETSVTKPWGYYDRSVLAVTVMSLQKALATIESLTARITALEAK